MMAPASFRHHRKQGGESPPSYSSLTFSLDGRRVSPLVHGLRCVGGARAHPRLDMSLCLSLFLRSGILPFHRFLYIRRSVTPIGLKPSPRFFSKISFLAERQPPGAHEGQGHACPPGARPPASWPPRAPSRVGFLPKNHKYSKNDLRPFLSRLDSV